MDLICLNGSSGVSHIYVRNVVAHMHVVCCHFFLRASQHLVCVCVCVVPGCVCSTLQLTLHLHLQFLRFRRLLALLCFSSSCSRLIWDKEGGRLVGPPDPTRARVVTYPAAPIAAPCVTCPPSPRETDHPRVLLSAMGLGGHTVA